MSGVVVSWEMKKNTWRQQMHLKSSTASQCLCIILVLSFTEEENRHWVEEMDGYRELLSVVKSERCESSPWNINFGEKNLLSWTFFLFPSLPSPGHHQNDEFSLRLKFFSLFDKWKFVGEECGCACTKVMRNLP